MLKKSARVRVTSATRAPGLKAGTVGEIVRTWPKGHEYHGKYFFVKFGDGKGAKTRVLARGVIEPVTPRAPRKRAEPAPVAQAS